jgi:acyl-homoserine-lactone acylase
MSARIWQRIGGVILGLAVAAVVVVVAVARPPTGAPLDGAEIRARAAQYDVTVYRDVFGVPHIYGARDRDVAFGLAYAHAEDDWDTIQLRLAATRGQSARLTGMEGARADYLVHLMRVWDVVEARYESDIGPETRALVEAYADGLNLYALENPDRVLSALLPVTGKDVVAGFVFVTPLFYGLNREIARILDPPDPAALMPGEETGGHAALGGLAALFEGMGSNAFAVAPSRSADGRTRLLINSHQPFDGPVAWYEVRLSSREGLDVAGGVFPGSPVMLHGHNRHLGWANTVNRPDLVDIYRLTIHPRYDDMYRFDGGWHELERREITLRIRLFGPFAWPVKRDVWYSPHHGPVLRTSHGTFAIRYAGMDEVRQIEQYYRLNRARNFAEWRNAMAMNALPSINYIYADAEGNIALLYNARMPKRAPGYDWRGILPGEDPRAIWHEYEPFDSLPFLVNPFSGFIINANNTPFRATEDGYNLDPEDYPDHFGIETTMTNRAYRALELFSADPAITREAFMAYKFDKGYSRDSKVGPLVERLLAENFSGDPLLREAQALLAEWDWQADVENRTAALALLTAYPVLREEHDGNAAPDPVAAFSRAARDLMRHYGRLDVPWGEINRLHRGAVDMPLGGGPDALRAVYAQPSLGEDGRLTARAGDTLIMMVEWDTDGALRSRSIHQYGTATLDESSPHFADQTPLFARERFKPVLWEREELLPTVTREYRPGAP